VSRRHNAVRTRADRVGEGPDSPKPHANACSAWLHSHDDAGVTSSRVAAAIAASIAAFWEEGPDGPHNETMRGSRYGAVGCGGYSKGGSLTLVQHFRPSA
jgi:hypothetical protein